MTFKSSFDNGNLRLWLQGRLDTNAVGKADEYIGKAIEESGNVICLTIDVEDLDFISSSGLRIMLALRKQFKDFHIVGASQEVYNVFELTGFVKLMDIQKSLRKVSVDGCQIIGRGGVGVVYKLTDDSIIKVFREGTSYEEVQNEISMSREAFVLGMPTAISFDVVKAGSQYGLVYEFLNADTLSKAISGDSGRLSEYARDFAHLMRSLHSIEVKPGGLIPDSHKREEAALNHIRRYFADEDVDRLMDILHSIPQGNSLLHCDLHPKNCMIQNGELMLIDMGEVGYGNPLIDLGHTYSSMMAIVGDYEKIIGLPESVSHEFFSIFIKEYFAGESKEEISRHLDEIQVVSLIRNFSWLSLSDSFPESLVSGCRECYKERVLADLPRIRRICQEMKAR